MVGAGGATGGADCTVGGGTVSVGIGVEVGGGWVGCTCSTVGVCVGTCVATGVFEGNEVLVGITSVGGGTCVGSGTDANRLQASETNTHRDIAMHNFFIVTPTKEFPENRGERVVHTRSPLFSGHFIKESQFQPHQTTLQADRMHQLKADQTQRPNGRSNVPGEDRS